MDRVVCTPIFVWPRVNLESSDNSSLVPCPVVVFAHDIEHEAGASCETSGGSQSSLSSGARRKRRKRKRKDREAQAAADRAANPSLQGLRHAVGRVGEDALLGTGAAHFFMELAGLTEGPIVVGYTRGPSWGWGDGRECPFLENNFTHARLFRIFFYCRHALVGLGNCLLCRD